MKRCKKLKGDRSDKAKKAREVRNKKRKRLSELKSKLSNAKSKFENSSASKKFKKASADLLSIPGPKETEFLKIGIQVSKVKGGSLKGREAYAVLNSPEIMNIVAKPLIFNDCDPITVGDPAVLSLANEYLRLRRKELKLTCYQRAFCHHEINLVGVLNGSASRVESVLYSDQIPLLSTHFRDHVIEGLVKNRELISRDSTTEFLNQRAMRREKKTKYARTFSEKAHQMNQRQHTEATAIDFRSGRTRRREANSTVFPKPEAKLI